MITLVLVIVFAIAIIAALVLELRRDLMMLQQNSYRNERYMRWLRTSGDTTSWIRITAMAVFMVSLTKFGNQLFQGLLIGIVGAIALYRLATAKYKKPLVFTSRAIRIYVVTLILSAVIIAASIVFAKCSDLTAAVSVSAIAAIGCFCGSHIIMVIANTILEPVQRLINKRYYNDARRRLADMPDLTIVGVTGSYGKTSTKHYLFEILSEHYDTLMTPGSFNTTLGVVRTIREMLKPYNQVFIVEMGAKQKGDIAEICELVKPQIGIVTAVGPQHLETFHSIENVRDTKFELVDSLPSNGLAVLNDDFEMIAGRDVNNVEAVRYSLNTDSNARFIASDIVYTPTGSTFKVTDRRDGKVLEFSTTLVGSCNISNLIAAVIVGLHLNVPVEKIKYAINRISQVEHRLKVTRTGVGYTVIDDAYNSNPVGSAMALEVLASMTGGRKFIITPGMIELGEDQCRLNCEFGKKIADSADIAIVVGKYNRDAIIEGILAVDPNQTKCKVHEADTFLQAHALFMSMMQPGDTVLYENDLPDTFK